MAESMVSQILDKSGKFYQAALGMIKSQLALIGTEFVGLRPKDNSKWKNVFGGSYSSESTLENDYTHFTATLIINMNDMKDVWNRNRTSLEAVTDDGSLEVGDELQYTRAGRTFRFKISQKQGYSETADTIYIYTLMSIIETLA